MIFCSRHSFYHSKCKRKFIKWRCPLYDFVLGAQFLLFKMENKISLSENWAPDLCTKCCKTYTKLKTNAAKQKWWFNGWADQRDTAMQPAAVEASRPCWALELSRRVEIGSWDQLLRVQSMAVARPLHRAIKTWAKRLQVLRQWNRNVLQRGLEHVYHSL